MPDFAVPIMPSTDLDATLAFYERVGFKWIRNWLAYRLSDEALEKLAQG